MGFGYHDVKLGCKGHALFFSEPFSGLLLLASDELLVFLFRLAVFTQKRTELIVYVKGVHPVAPRVQLVEKILRIFEEIFFGYGVDFRLAIAALRLHRSFRDFIGAGTFLTFLTFFNTVAPFIVSDFMLHGKLSKLSHLQKQRLYLEELHGGKGGAAASRNGQGWVLYLHENFLNFICKSSVLLYKANHFFHSVKLLPQLLLLAGIIGLNLLQLFFAERSVQVQIEHHIIKTGFPPCLYICKSSVFSLSHSYILTSITGMSGIAFCISSKRNLLSKV